MGAIDTTISTIRRAVELSSKLAVAGRAGLRDTVLRGLESDSWNPTAETLRKLEAAAHGVIAEKAEAAKAVSA